MTLTNDQKKQYRNIILDKINTLTNVLTDGWIRLADLGQAIKQSNIDYKAIGFTGLFNFLRAVFGSKISHRGEYQNIEVRFYDKNADEDPVETCRSNSSSQKICGDKPQLTIPLYVVRNQYRGMVNESSIQGGWVNINDLEDAVGWNGSDDEFISSYELQVNQKSENLVRISNISRFELFDDIFFDKKSNPYQKILEELRELALEEPWNLNYKQNGLLDNYLIYTYARVKEEGIIEQSTDGLYACWNTGLVDKRYCPIYCFMRRRTASERWVFQGFCIEGEDLGKTMVSHILNLPPRAKYFTSENLLFNPEPDKLSVDYGHIINEHPSRLPEEWLKHELGDAAAKEDKETDNHYDKRVGKLISLHRDASGNLQLKLQQAIKISLSRCEWNYKTAIPYYDPQSKNIGWFLPLCIPKDGLVPFAALVVTKQSSGRYQGQTIYKLSWAYNCARLVCRPDSDWLSPSRSAEMDIAGNYDE